jgi:hypothetical protein
MKETKVSMQGEEFMGERVKGRGKERRGVKFLGFLMKFLKHTTTLTTHTWLSEFSAAVFTIDIGYNEVPHVYQVF